MFAHHPQQLFRLVHDRHSPAPLQQQRRHLVGLHVEAGYRHTSVYNVAHREVLERRAFGCRACRSSPRYLTCLHHRSSLDLSDTCRSQPSLRRCRQGRTPVLRPTHMLGGHTALFDLDALHLLLLAAQRRRDLIRTLRQVDEEPGAGDLLPGNVQHRRSLGIAKREGHTGHEGLPARRKDQLQRKQRVDCLALDLADAGAEVPDLPAPVRSIPWAWPSARSWPSRSSRLSWMNSTRRSSRGSASRISRSKTNAHHTRRADRSAWHSAAWSSARRSRRNHTSARSSSGDMAASVVDRGAVPGTRARPKIASCPRVESTSPTSS